MRNARQMFEAAIEHGYLSAKPSDKNYAGYMFMMMDENGKALFKNIDDRSYLPAMEI